MKATGHETHAEDMSYGSLLVMIMLETALLRFEFVDTNMLFLYRTCYNSTCFCKSLRGAESG